MTEPLLTVSDLSVTFNPKTKPVYAVRGVDYSVAPGEFLGIVGESGSGKSVSSMAVMGLLPSSAQVQGSIRFDGQELVGFVMISDHITDPGDDLVGPYYLWRLLIDAASQGRGYGAATIDAVVAYLRTRPGADILWTSCAKGDGGPLPFYLRCGFVQAGDVQWDDDEPEHLLRLDLTTMED